MNKKSFYDFFMSVIYLYKIVTNLKKNRRCVLSRNVKREICVLGSGPSMTESIRQIQNGNRGDIHFFAMNDFAVSDFYTTCKPRYYILLDPCYWTPKEQTNDCDFEMRKNTFGKMNSMTNWEMELFIPAEVYKCKYLDNVITNPQIKLRPFNYSNYYPTKTSFYYWILKNNYGVVPVGNVLGGAIYLSINMGYKTIKLVGAEHSWTKDIRVDDDNRVCTIKRHFYGDGTLEPWLKSNKEPFLMCEILQSLCNHFRGYLYLDWYAKRCNATVYNCTKGSFIDAFTRLC